MSISNSKIMEHTKTDVHFHNQDVASGVTSDLYVDMSIAQKIMLVAIVHLESGATLTLQPVQATDSAGTSSKNLGSSVTLTNETGTERDCILRTEKKVTDLDDDTFTHVGGTVTVDQASGDGTLISIREGLTYRGGADQTGVPAVNVVTTTAGA